MGRALTMTRTEGTNSETGAAVVEFALVAPLLFLLIFGIIDLGRAYSTLNRLAASVREGARLAAVLPNPASSGSQAQIRQTVRQFSPSRIDGQPISDGQIVITFNQAAGTVTVAVQAYPFQLVTPLAGVVGLRVIPVTREATFRWERAAIP